MSPTVIVGLDGSPESSAAADWAAREALRRAATLDLVQVQEAGPYPYPRVAADHSAGDGAEEFTRPAEEELTARYPALRTMRHALTGRPSRMLSELSENTDVLVLGSRGLGAMLGFIVGSTALPTVAHAGCPVVLVRSRDAAPAPDDSDPVVLATHLERQPDTVTEFAFDAAARRSAKLVAVHVWEPPPAYGVRPIARPSSADAELVDEKTGALAALLRPWQEKYPDVETEFRAPVGHAAHRLLEESQGAAMVVVGRRRRRRSPVGARIGSVTHAVMHHAEVPVAVVPPG